MCLPVAGEASQGPLSGRGLVECGCLAAELGEWPPCRDTGSDLYSLVYQYCYFRLLPNPVSLSFPICKMGIVPPPIVWGCCNVVTKGSCYCSCYSYYPSFPWIILKAGRQRAQACPCVRAPGHPRSGWSPSSEAMTTEVLLKHTRQTSRANTLAQYGALEGAGRRLAMARAGLLDTPEVAGPGLGWPGLPGPGRSRLPDAGAILLLSWPLLWVGSVALALPQEQVAFAAWHLSLEGGCQQGANLGISLCVLWVLAQGLFAPGGVRPGPSWWRASERGSSSLPRAPPTPQLSLSR